MSNVVRLVSGGSIQVRTGVIQGIGPQGPRGLVGSQGVQGEQGPVGDTGPMGAILQLQGKTEVNTANSMGANTDTVIGWGSVTYDDLACFQPGTTNCTLSSPGDYMLSAWLRFDAAAATSREIWFRTGSTTIARKSTTATTGIFYVDLAFPFRAAGGEVINVLARSGSATAAGQGAWAVTRMGSGPPGPQGPVGPEGPVGATGAQGPQGATGSASSGFTTYAKLIGPN